MALKRTEKPVERKFKPLPRLSQSEALKSIKQALPSRKDKEEKNEKNK